MKPFGEMAAVEQARVMAAIRKPTRHFRWRALSDEPRQRSILEQLWVDDLACFGEWRQVPRVEIDAPAFVEAGELPAVL